MLEHELQAYEDYLQKYCEIEFQSAITSAWEILQSYRKLELVPFSLRRETGVEKPRLTTGVQRKWLNYTQTMA